MRTLQYWLPVLIIALGVSACATTSFTDNSGNRTPFSQDKCVALSQWVEPLQWRYPNSHPSGWMEKPTRDRMKFLFTDPYFIPVFGTPVDALTDRQVKAIYDTLQSTRRAKNPCKDETYLMSLYPGIFLARVFDPRFATAIFSRPFVNAHAKATRADPQRNNQPGKATIQLVQKRISQAGFNVGSPDGVIGTSTTDGIIQYKKSKNMQPADGMLSPALLARLDAYHIPAPKVVKPKPRRTPSTTRSRTDRPANTSRQKAPTNKADADSLRQSMDKLNAGSPINLNGQQRSYFAGVAGAVLQECPSIGTYTERSKLSGMITSVMLLNPLMDIYSNDNLGQAMARGTSSAGLLNAGYVVGNRLGCGRKATTIISALADSL